MYYFMKTIASKEFIKNVSELIVSKPTTKLIEKVIFWYMCSVHENKTSKFTWYIVQHISLFNSCLCNFGTCITHSCCQILTWCLVLLHVTVKDCIINDHCPINIRKSPHSRRKVNSPDLVGMSEIVVAAKLSHGRDFDKSETGHGTASRRLRIILKQNSLF